MWGLMIIAIAQLAMVIIILLSMAKFFEGVNIAFLLKLFYFFVMVGFFGAIVSIFQLIIGILDFIF